MKKLFSLLLLSSTACALDLESQMQEARRTIFDLTQAAQEDLRQAVISENLSDALQAINDGAFVNAMLQRNTVNPLLGLSAAKNMPEAVEFFIKYGANVNGIDHILGAPLHQAARTNAADATKVLLKNGAEVDIRHNGETPLHRAAYRNAANVIQELLSGGANIEAQSPSGTPLHHAAGADAQESVTLLLDKGANKEARDSKNRTPLHTALYNEAYNTAKLLTRRGASVVARDSNKQTPINIAETSDTEGLREELLDIARKLRDHFWTQKIWTQQTGKRTEQQ